MDERLLKDFKKWLIEEGRASKTVESYVSDINGYQKFLSERAADEKQPLSRFSFVRYKQYLLNQKFEASTINKKINSLRVYNDFWRKGYFDAF